MTAGGRANSPVCGVAKSGMGSLTATVLDHVTLLLSAGRKMGDERCSTRFLLFLFYAVKVPYAHRLPPHPPPPNTHSGWLFSARVKFSGNALRDTPKMYFHGDANSHSADNSNPTAQ